MLFLNLPGHAAGLQPESIETVLEDLLSFLSDPNRKRSTLTRGKPVANPEVIGRRCRYPNLPQDGRELVIGQTFSARFVWYAISHLPVALCFVW